MPAAFVALPCLAFWVLNKSLFQGLSRRVGADLWFMFPVLVVWYFSAPTGWSSHSSLLSICYLEGCIPLRRHGILFASSCSNIPPPPGCGVAPQLPKRVRGGLLPGREGQAALRLQLPERAHRGPRGFLSRQPYGHVRHLQGKVYRIPLMPSAFACFVLSAGCVCLFVGPPTFEVERGEPFPLSFLVAAFLSFLVYFFFLLFFLRCRRFSLL